MKLRQKYFLPLGFLLFSLASMGQSSIMKFESLSTDDGLSQGVITSITEDERGIIWLGTQNGLNRLIGRNITVYHHQDSIPDGLPSDQISTLARGPEGKIWIGTMNDGIASLEPGTATFKTYIFRNEKGQEVQSAQISRILFRDDHMLYAAAGVDGLFIMDLDAEEGQAYQISADDGKYFNVVDLFFERGELWLGTLNKGLVQFDPEKGIVRHLFIEDPTVRWHYNEVKRIVPAPYPWIWVGTSQNSLFKVNRINGDTLIFREAVHPVYHHANVMDMLFLGPDSLLLATAVGGLQYLDIPKGEMKALSREDFPFGVPYNTINCLYRADNGILWVGTNGKGIAYNHPGSNRFTVYSKSKPADYKLSFESVRCIYSDDDYLFAGGYYGVNRINRSTGEVVHWLKDIAVYCLCEVEGHSDQLLLGSEGNGIYLIDKNRGTLSNDVFRKGFGFYNENDFIPFDMAYALAHLQGDEYLLGHSFGMAVYSHTKKAIIRNYTHSNDPYSIVSGEIKSILIDSNDRIWIGSATGGMCRFDPKTDHFFSLDAKNGYHPLPNPKVLDIFEDQDQRIWVGTMEGLCQVSPETGFVRSFTEKDGLPNNSIASIEQSLGVDGLIWMGSNEGISALDPETGVIDNYSELDGLPGNEMNRGASYAGNDSVIYFGGVDGIIRFTSSSLNRSYPRPLPQVIAYFEFNNLKNTDTLLPYSNRIVVPPGVDYFSLEVTGSDVIFEEQNVFQYRVPGIFDDWVNMNSNRRITFNSVKPGNYRVGLKVSHDAKNWVENDPAVYLIVEPMFYQTWIAKIIFVLLFLGIIILGIYLRTNYLNRQKQVLNKLVDIRTEELKQSERSLMIANETKDRFFSILAHDLKSPFSALLGLSEFLAGDWSEYNNEERHKMAKSIHVTLNSTYRLLSNLLEWSRMQMGVISPENTNINLRRLVKDVLEAHEVVMSSKDISVKIEIQDKILVWGDSKMTETILRNFLSNAVKYSNPGSTIGIRAKPDKDNIVISVLDSGTGIDPKTQEIIFNFKETVSKPGTGGEKGTGLGLMLSKEFAHKMGGEIGFKSTPGEGSEFWFTLPSAI